MKYLQEFRVFENSSPLLELSNNADVLYNNQSKWLEIIAKKK